MANIGDKYIESLLESWLSRSFANPIFTMLDCEEVYSEEVKRISENPAKNIARAHYKGQSQKLTITHDDPDRITVEQAIEKLRTYEAEKKAEEEIKVGDVVYGKNLGYHTKIIVLRKNSDGELFSGGRWRRVYVCQ